MKKSALFLISALFLVGLTVEARGIREGKFQAGRPQRFGNENSQHITQLSVGAPTYNGNGCPQGTMRVAFSPDFLSFSILFDQFVAEAGDVVTNGRFHSVNFKFDNIICNTLIPIQIPDGMQMEITRIDYRGFSSLPDKSNGFLNSIVNFRGPGGDADQLTLRYNFKGPVTDNYEISTDQSLNGNSELSPCGGKTQLRISNQLWIVSRSMKESAALTLDSIDGSSNAVYYVNWRACKAANAPPVRPRSPIR